jgi:hypothetical protein
MIKKLSIALCFLLLQSCASLSVNNLVRNSSAIKSAQKTAFFFRLSNGNPLEESSLNECVSYWLEGAVKLKPLTFVQFVEDPLGLYNSEYDRFFQLDINNKYLRYKSQGVMQFYIRQNEAALQKIMTDTESDILFIYEVDSWYSVEMQTMGFRSIVLGINRKMEIVFLDNQEDNFTLESPDPFAIKKNLTDKISERLLVTMDGLDIIKSSR